MMRALKLRWLRWRYEHLRARAIRFELSEARARARLDRAMIADLNEKGRPLRHVQ